MRARVLSFLAIGLVLIANLCDPTVFPPDPNAAGHFAVALYGDSLTKAPGYEPYLSEAYYTLVRGSAGERGIEGAPRLIADLPQKLAVIEEADVVVMMWGTNDVGWFNYVEHPKEIAALLSDWLGGIPPGEDLDALPPGTTIEMLVADWRTRGVITQAQADQILANTASRSELVAKLVDAAGQAVLYGLKVVVSLPPDVWSGEQLALRNARLAACRSNLAASLAASFPTSVVRVVNLAPLFAGQPALYADDGLHWKEAGKQVAGQAIDAEVDAFAD